MPEGLVLKSVAVVVILSIWAVITYFVGYSCYTVWRMKDLDVKATKTLLYRSVMARWRNPFETITSHIREKSEPTVVWTPLAGYTPPPSFTGKIDERFLADKKQYSFTVSNSTDESFKDVSWVLQFPYPVEESFVSEEIGCTQARFSVAGGGLMLIPSGGEIEVSRRPKSRSYSLSVVELQPKGVIKLLILLNSERDPRGKRLPLAERQRYQVPRVDPSLTYVYGSYKILAGNQVLDDLYYAPFSLDESKIVSLGLSQAAPTNLAVVRGFQ